MREIDPGHLAYTSVKPGPGGSRSLLLTPLALCAVCRKVSIRMLHECFITTVSVTAMIMLIAAAAF